MSLPAIVFKSMLKTLASQFIDNGQTHAECIGEDFGSQFNSNAKLFFSISLIEENLPHDLAAIGVLVDNRAAEFNRNGYTFFIFIDSSKKHEEFIIIFLEISKLPYCLDRFPFLIYVYKRNNQ